jgi:hypothetical protein
VKAHTQIDSFFVEKERNAYKVLSAVAHEYRTRGLNIETRSGECGDSAAAESVA